MVSAKDIAPVPRKVDIRGTVFVLKGLSFRHITELFAVFPDLATMIMGGKPDLGRLIMGAPDAVAAIIAAGMRAPDEAEHVAELVIEDQLALLTPTVELTMPNGIGPFAALMERMGVGNGRAGAPAMRVQDTNSPPPLQSMATGMPCLRARKRSGQTT